jgi:hypothetical protein
MKIKLQYKDGSTMIADVDSGLLATASILKQGARWFSFNTIDHQESPPAVVFTECNPPLEI